jgi:hypothetical protein
MNNITYVEKIKKHLWMEKIENVEKKTILKDLWIYDPILTI